MTARGLGPRWPGLGRGVAQPGSASDWGSGGRRFESCRPDQLFRKAKPSPQEQGFFRLLGRITGKKKARYGARRQKNCRPLQLLSWLWATFLFLPKTGGFSFDNRQALRAVQAVASGRRAPTTGTSPARGWRRRTRADEPMRRIRPQPLQLSHPHKHLNNRPSFGSYSVN